MRMVLGPYLFPVWWPMTLPFDPLPYCTILEYGHYEACKHKYHLSEAEGKDLGHVAYRDWFKLHWVTFYHHRWIQHLFGQQRFDEFDRSDYFSRIRSSEDGKLWAGDVQLCPIAVGFVQRMFLREHRPWEHLIFVSNRTEIGQLGFDYDEVSKVLEAFGINECRIHWDEMFEVEKCHFREEFRRHIRQKQGPPGSDQTFQP